MSQSSDSTAIRTSGTVLCLIGLVSFGAVAFWNSMGAYPAKAELERLSGTLVLGHLRIVTTRTSMEHWVVVDVHSARDGTAGGEMGDASKVQERWVFPGHTQELAERISALEVGAKVSSRALVDPERLRWTEIPVRIILSLSLDTAANGSAGPGEVVSYDEIIALAYAARYQSPIVGWLMLGLGGALLLGSRFRVGGGQDLAVE